jgi:hypothetical protein
LFADVRGLLKLSHVGCGSLGLNLLFEFLKIFSGFGSGNISGEGTDFIILSAYDEISQAILGKRPNGSWELDGLLAGSISEPYLDCAVITSRGNFSSDEGEHRKDKSHVASECLEELSVS